MKEFNQEICNDKDFESYCLSVIDNVYAFKVRKGFDNKLIVKAYYSRKIRDLEDDDLMKNILDAYNTITHVKNGKSEYEWGTGFRGRNFTPEDKKWADEFYESFEKIIKDNRDGLIKNRNDSLLDHYGNRLNIDYFGNEVGSYTFEMFNENIISGKGFEEYLPYFFRKMILRDNEFPQFLKSWYNYANVYNPLNIYNQPITFWTFFKNSVEEVVYPDVVAKTSSVNQMSGEVYEEYCGSILRNAGWIVEVTKNTNDQGVDIIAKIEDKICCIQCKRYSNPVGNKAVQEIYAGTKFYSGTDSVVVSNAGFTKQAEELARSLRVILISDSKLAELENFIL